MNKKGLIFDIKRNSSEDGPGIRTTVFFKGCPLSCIWCQNPEGKNFKPEVDKEGRAIGQWYTVEELSYRLLQDKSFFLSTGGGVTLSGGEAMMQMDFASELLQELKKKGIHTALETSGFFYYPNFREKVLPWLDLIYFDIKIIDIVASKKYCGSSSERILDNFSHLMSEAIIPVMPRVPLIPGITTSKENLQAIAKILDQYNAKSCSLMPYNPLWQDKPQQLGITPTYRNEGFMSLEEQKACIQYFTN